MRNGIESRAFSSAVVLQAVDSGFNIEFALRGPHFIVSTFMTIEEGKISLGLRV
jgi:hypothetical protein